MKRYSKVILSLILCAMVLLICPFALAQGKVDVNAPCTLSIRYEFEQQPVSGAVFHLYRVADVDEDLVFTAVAPFQNVGSDAKSITEDALGLAAQIRTLNVPAKYTMTTDETGAADLTDLRPGAWLLIGEPTQGEEGTYYVDPQVIILPGENPAGEYEYTVTVQPKSTRLPVGETLVSRTVVKVWKDQGHEKDRPKSITVRLLKDGAAIDTVVLSAENNWRYTWSELLPNANWTVQEDVPEKYSCQLTESDGMFTLTNKYEKLPQTGFIWWPVALVCGLGLLLVIVGVILRRSGRNEA